MPKTSEEIGQELTKSQERLKDKGFHILDLDRFETFLKKEWYSEEEMQEKEKEIHLMKNSADYFERMFKEKEKEIQELLLHQGKITERQIKGIIQAHNKSLLEELRKKNFYQYSGIQKLRKDDIVVKFLDIEMLLK